MISSLLFLILVLLLASVVPEPTVHATGALDFVRGLSVYLFSLILITGQNRLNLRHVHKRLLFLANVELLIALFLFQFFFYGSHYLKTVPYVGTSVTFTSFFLIGMYLLGLAVHYGTSRSGSVHAELRLLVPFTLPFLFFCFFIDLSALIPLSPFIQPQTITGQLLVITVLGLFFILFVMLTLPPLMIHMWQCRPLQKSAREPLQQLCARAHFSHNGIMTWPVVGSGITAAIVGIFPQLRYILFSRRILEILTPDGLEAVLAHEIGHSRHKHLMLYPFLILGVMALLAVYESQIDPIIQHYLQAEQQGDPSGPWQGLKSLSLFLPEVAIFLAYLRYVFGYFSRLFERQADLFVFEVAIPPQHLIAALDAVAIHSGHIHDLPNWHHYGIRERMDFLEAASRDPTLIHRHHRRVRRALLIYTALILIACLLWLA